ncbi:hypothetical protein GCM10010344_75020 [Streptomyces bluensis]|nr:hypothetical protein GCM10010344_75020 [Streptomyces bluensis]
MFRKSRRPPEGRAPRRLVRAIARRRSALIAELFGRFGNAASVRARRRGAGGTFETRPRPSPDTAPTSTEIQQKGPNPPAASPPSGQSESRPVLSRQTAAPTAEETSNNP